MSLLGRAAHEIGGRIQYGDQPERGVTYWDWSLTPVKDEVGRVPGLVFSLGEMTQSAGLVRVSIDITEAKRSRASVPWQASDKTVAAFQQRKCLCVGSCEGLLVEPDV